MSCRTTRVLFALTVVLCGMATVATAQPWLNPDNYGPNIWNASVGVGTATPLSVNGSTAAGKGFHVYGSGVATAVLDSGSVGAQLLLNDRTQPANSRLLRQFLSGGNVTFTFMNDNFTEKTNVLTLKGSGNVGIGTTSPNARLDVNGGVHATGDITSD